MRGYSVVLRNVALGLCGLAAGCGVFSLDDPPATELLVLESPECSGTREGRACLTIAFVLHKSVRNNADGDLQGRMLWGLYKGGTVSWDGPDDRAVKLFGTPEPPPNLEALPFVDFKSVAEYAVTLSDIPAGAYQLVVYLDDDDSGDADTGDPVSLPTDAFKVLANEHTRVEGVMNYLMF